MMRQYTIDMIENIYQTHYIISISPEWNRAYSWSKEGRTIHEYKGAGDGAKILINAPASIKGEFLNLLLQKAFVNNSTLVTIPHNRLNDLSLKFKVVAIESIGH